MDLLSFYKRDLTVENYEIGYLRHPYVSLYTGRGCRSNSRSGRVARSSSGGSPGPDSSVCYTQSCPRILIADYGRSHCDRLVAMLRL